MIVVSVMLVPVGDPSYRKVIASSHIAKLSDPADVSSYLIAAIEAANPLCGTAGRFSRREPPSRAVSVGRALAALETADFVEL
jgi:hypothetical protein